MRIGECLGLRYETMVIEDTPVSTIIIPADITKTKQERQIPVSTTLFDALSRYIFDYPVTNPIYANVYFFWTRSRAKRISNRTIERIFQTVGLESIGRPVWPHMLRHTLATRLMRVTDIRTVQTILGHKCLSSTQVYTHPSNDDMKSAIDALQ